MLTFRRFTVLFFLVLLSMNLYSIFGCGMAGTILCEHMPVLYVSVIVIYFTVSFILAFLPCSQFHYPVLCNGDTGGKDVAVTFDDGPHPAATPRILGILKAMDVPAAFFVSGKNIDGNEEILRRMDSEGHLIATHCWSHSYWFDFFTPRMIRKELVRTAEEISRTTGRAPLLFRPPYGVVNPMVSGALRRLPWTVVAWNIRSLDTVAGDPEAIMRRILKQLKPGAVILLHDHSAFSANHLEALVTGIRSAGFGIKPLDRLLNVKAYAD